LEVHQQERQGKKHPNDDTSIGPAKSSHKDLHQTAKIRSVGIVLQQPGMTLPAAVVCVRAGGRASFVGGSAIQNVRPPESRRNSAMKTERRKPPVASVFLNTPTVWVPNEKSESKNSKNE
jgi:hypothetical protein